MIATGIKSKSRRAMNNHSKNRVEKIKKTYARLVHEIVRRIHWFGEVV